MGLSKAEGPEPGRSLDRRIGESGGEPLQPVSFPQDNDVLLHWAPVEEAGDSTQIFFSKKVGLPFFLLLHLLFSWGVEGI